MIGTHPSPPHMTVQMMNVPLSEHSRNQMDDLYRQQTLLMEQGFAYRMTMQEQVIELLSTLPDDTASVSLRNRFHNEQLVGELKIWQDLIRTLPAQ